MNFKLLLSKLNKILALRHARRDEEARAWAEVLKREGMDAAEVERMFTLDLGLEEEEGGGAETR